MPRVTVSGIASVVMVVLWSGVYFYTRTPRSSQFLEAVNYEDIKNEADYDGRFYPMDDPSMGKSTNDSNGAPTSSQRNKIKSTEQVSNSNDTQWETETIETIVMHEESNGAKGEKSNTTSSIWLNYDLNYFGEYDARSTTESVENNSDALAWMLYENVTVEEKRGHIKKMMQHAWDNYVKYAWGGNELRPISRRVHPGSVFGMAPLGVTIVDSLDTLYIMGLMNEYKKGREWIESTLKIENLDYSISVFEVNIRIVGGLLSCYALTGDTVFRDKAQQVVEKLLPAFETPTGIPHSLVDFESGSSGNYGWASGGSSILSEIGTLHLEFAYLSDITGNPNYRNKTDHVRRFLHDLEKPKGLYPNYVNPRTGKWSSYHSSMGSLGDSFYEYLLKAWLQTNKTEVDIREMFDEAMEAIMKHMLQISPGGLMYFAEVKVDLLLHRMEHLACFSGGLFALASKTLQNELSNRYMEIAKEITHTCHETYNRTYTKIGPEAFRFTDDVEAEAVSSSEKHNILRPEVIESYFYLYRLTKDDKYRDWGWEAVVAYERHCRVDGGYSGIRDVYSMNPMKDDVQQSFFMSETLKYLYLLFSDDTVYSLDEWVFNTEAHPLPIKGVNSFYREAV